MDFLSVEDICKKLRPVFGAKIDELYLNYRMADSREAKLEIEQALNGLYHKYLSGSMLSDKILLEPPQANLVDGEYPLAYVSYDDKKLYPFCLREKDWVRHMCISGMTGSGKTTFAYHVVYNFIEKGKPFIVFDWKKSFRPLLLLDKEILLFTVGNDNISNLFKFNINMPPKGVPPREWLNTLCDLITESFFASYGVHKLLSETIDEAFKDFGVYDGSENYPNWFQIKDRLEERSKSLKRKGRESEWITSALRIAHVLTFGPFGEAINYKGKSGMTFDELLEKKVIFELNSLSNTEKQFFCGFLLTYIYKFKKANQEGCSDMFKHAIVVDEAHNIFLKERPHFIKETVTDMVYREIREYGTSLICLDQHISKLSDTVAGNSACNVAFQQMLYLDVETVSGIMQLRDRKKYFSMLPVGQAIVRLAERYHEPFLIDVPFVDIKNETVTDDSVAKRMKKMIGTKQEFEEFVYAADPKNVVKELKRVDEIFKVSGVDTGDAYKKVQEKIATNAQKLVDEDNKRKEDELKASKRIIVPKGVLMNHVQEFLAEYMNEQLDKGYDSRTIKEAMLKSGYKHDDVNKAVVHVILTQRENRIKKESHEEVITSVSSDDTSNSYLSKTQKQLLEFISKNPAFGTTTVYKYLGLSVRKGDRLKKQLVGMGLVKSEAVKDNKGWRKYLKPTSEGLKIAKENPGRTQ
jgi:hypothetical protein